MQEQALAGADCYGRIASPMDADTTIHDARAAPAPLRPPSMMSTSNVDTDTFGSRIRLKELRVQHRDLDVAIAELIKNPHADQLRVNRLKKQKLRLKDMINRLESELIPDLNA